MTNILTNLCILAIKAYRRCLSPLLGPRCRFYPSCSEYALHCLQEQQLALAILRITKRLLKCNPLHPGGVDLP